MGNQYRQAGLPDEEAMEAQRVLGRGMARYVEAITALVGAVGARGRHRRARAGRPPRGGLDDAAAARRPVARARLRAAPARGAAAGGRSPAEQLASGRLDSGRDCAVGLRRPRRLHRAGRDDPGRGARQRRRPALAAGRGGGRAAGEDRQGDRRRGDARLARAGARWSRPALRLVEGSEGEEGCRRSAPAIAYGPAVNRWGDWYGSTVNVASRLTSRARPSSVLATEAVRDARDGGYEWSFAGEKKLKGLSAPLRTYRARRRG